MIRIAAFYRFLEITDPDSMVEEVETQAHSCGLMGSILVASEGVNGTVAAAPEQLDEFAQWLTRRFDLGPDAIQYAHTTDMPFRRMTVRLKDEIVSLGVDGIDPRQRVGKYVSPHAWDQLVQRDDVMLIDCRNSYEFEVGTFEGAIDPGTESFREFAEYARNLDPSDNPKVAMFCTGGIRCEKATGLMLELGFDEVFHLQGGILRYLQERGAEAENAWRGECFVFDRRVTVDRTLQPGTYELCWACRMPISDADRESPRFEEGVSCPGCYEDFSEDERAKKRERHRQFTR